MNPSDLDGVSFEVLLAAIGRRLDGLRAAPQPTADVLVSATTIAQHVPPGTLTARAFADGCRANRWPSFKAGRSRVAKLADVLAALATREAPQEGVEADDEGDDDARLLAAAGVRLRAVGGRR